jgi:hypothetical protein
MAKANINDRGSIELVYSPDDYATDAAANQKQPANPYQQGVRLTQPPGPDGFFELSRAKQQVGEIAGAVFLAPNRPLEGDAAHDLRAGYDGFIDEILAALPALRDKADASPGPHDPRLRGPRQ